MTKYNNKVIWTYVTRVFSFFTLSTFLPFLKISENNIKRLWTYLKCPFSGHRLWSDTDNIIKRKSYIIHNIWPSEFVITGEGTVINFPYIQLPFINCNNKGSICSSKAFLWFPLVSFLLFFFISFWLYCFGWFHQRKFVPAFTTSCRLKWSTEAFVTFEAS